MDVPCPCESIIALKQMYQILKDETHHMWGTSVSIQPVVMEIIKLILLRTYQETVLNLEICAY